MKRIEKVERTTKMEIITFATIKGGIGKTTLSFNYGEWLASKGKKVLLMDLDQQSSLSRTYNITDQNGTVEEIFNVFNDDDMRKPVKIHHVNQNIDLIAGTTRLDKIQSRLETKNNKNMILFSYLQDHFEDIVSHYDYMIIDCHPDIGIATINAIVVSDAIISPVTPSKFSYDSIIELETRLDEVKKETINFATGESFVKAKVFYVANMIKHNTGISREFLATIEKEKQNGENWIAEIPEKEIFNRSIYYQVSVSRMEELAKSTDPIDQNLAAIKKYASSQRPETYFEINNIFETITKHV